MKNSVTASCASPNCPRNDCAPQRTKTGTTSRNHSASTSRFTQSQHHHPPLITTISWCIDPSEDAPPLVQDKSYHKA